MNDSLFNLEDGREKVNLYFPFLDDDDDDDDDNDDYNTYLQAKFFKEFRAPYKFQEPFNMTTTTVMVINL